MANPELRFKNDNDDWVSDRIEELFSLSQGEQIPIEQQFYNYENGMERFIRIVDLTKNDEPVRYVFPNSLKGKVNSDDVFLVRYGAVGTIGYGYEGIIANNLFKLKDKDRSMNHSYLYHVLNSPKINNRIIDISSSTTMPALNFTSFNEIELNYSSSMEVQKEISSMLSNIDNKISNEELLIKKLKDIKSSLLTKMFPQEGQSVPELRFKGHTDSWEQRKLFNYANFLSGNGLSWNDISDNGKCECILYGNLYTEYGMISDKIVYKTNKNVKNPVYSIYGDVLIPASDTTPTGLARATCIEKSGVLLGGDINIIRPKDNINGSFLSLAINKNKSELIKLIKGTTVRHIHNSEIKDITVPFTSNINEQEKIVSVFKSLENLITLHESKLEKLKRIKLALLNKLLV